MNLNNITSGIWSVRCLDGAVHIIDLNHHRYHRQSGNGSVFSVDDSSLGLAGIDHCAVGDPARLTLQTDHYFHHRQTARVQSIEAYDGEPLSEPEPESADEARARWDEFRSGAWLPEVH